MSVRVRYAPSPTGSPHVGNIRTALYCHLFARHHDGIMMLRIEDTDRSRFVPGCEEENIETMNWLGIDYQEGPGIGGPHSPYRQSERKEAGIYQPHIDRLLADGNAYWAFDTAEELAEMREFQQINKQAIGYFGGVWRDASSETVEQAMRGGKPGVIRLKIPRDRTLVCQDAIRGRIEWDSDTIDDPVLIKADGMPTYHFAAMVDDHLMGTTHIFRGEEWISSAPKHVFLFEAYGWEPPIFIHLPVIKGKDGAKLSKRHGDTRCLDFRAAGYLPEALANFIALIGWSPGGDRELMTMPEMVEAFDITGFQPSSGVFDLEKLEWMNGHYIRQEDAGQLADRVHRYALSQETVGYWSGDLRAADPTGANLALLAKAAQSDPETYRQAIVLEQERVKTLADFGQACQFFFVEQPEFDSKATEKWFGEPHVGKLYGMLVERLDAKSSCTVEECEEIVRGLAVDFGFEKLGPVVHPIRVALTGKTAGPGLFELMSVLGPTRMIQRLQRASGMLVSSK